MNGKKAENMKKFHVNLAKKGKKVLMPRTNYCPVLVNGETETAINNSWNPSGMTSTHKVVKLTKREATIKLTEKLNGRTFAEVNLIFNTRNGRIRNDSTYKIVSKGFDETKDWIKAIELARKYAIGLIREFSILNNEEYKKAMVRPEPVMAAEKIEKREYNYSLTQFERKGFYRNRNGKTFYVRPTVVKP